MNKISFFYFVIVLFCSASCNQQTKSNKKAAVSLQIREDKLKPSFKDLSHYIDSFYVVRLQNNPPIGSLKKILVFDDKIFALDKKTQSILIFDINGTFKNVINKVGKGPGEYIKIADFTLNQKKRELIIMDHFALRYIVYDFNGNYLHSKRFKKHADQFVYLKSNKYANLNDYNSKLKNDCFNIFITDTEGEEIKKDLEFDDSYLENNFKKDDYFCISDSVVNFIRNYDNNVYRITDDGAVIPKYYIDLGKFNSPEGVIQTPHDNTTIKQYASNLSSFYETANTITFKYVINGKLKTIYFNKNTRNYLSSNYPFLPDNLFLGWGYRTVAEYKGFFVSAVDYPQNIVDFVKPLRAYINKRSLNKVEKNIIQEYSSVKGDDNPILFFYRLKNF